MDQPYAVIIRNKITNVVSVCQNQQFAATVRLLLKAHYRLR